MLLFIVLPAVGLAIDGGVAFAVKARLQTATDGAALAAARSLSRGIGLSAQRSSAEATAREFFDANMNWSWDSLQNPSRLVSWPTAPPKTTIVKLDTAVDAPTYFMKILGYNSLRIRAAGAANRRDVNIMMVIDRSESLDQVGACDDMRVAARSFVETFVDGRDRLGLVTFGTTYNLDFPPAFDFRSRSGNPLPDVIDRVRCTGYTNAAAGYWQGWSALQALNEPGTLNVILFFTDGKPNTLTLDQLVVKGSSSCANKSNKSGVIAASPSGDVLGIFQPVEPGPPPARDPDNRIIGSSNSCRYSSDSRDVADDIVSLTPSGAANEIDAFGNRLDTNYKWPIRRTSGRIRIDDRLTVENAGYNALDDAALRVRSLSATSGLDVITYTIALGGPGAPEDLLMRRLANADHPSNTIYDSSKPSGLYVYAASASQLEQAFGQLASDILRISQ